jgi:hypothetical protein
MMQEAAPFFVAVRLAKSDDVIFEGLPGNQKQVAIRRLDAPAKLEAGKAGGGFEQWAALPECRLELRFPAGLYVEERCLKDHGSIFSASLPEIQKDFKLYRIDRNLILHRHGLFLISISSFR